MYGKEHSDSTYIEFAYVIQCLYVNSDKIAVHYFIVLYRVPQAWAEVTSILHIMAEK
jgi:hypothetical protein